MSKTTGRQFTIAGQPFRLTRPQVERAMRGVLPDPVQSHYVVAGGRRFPPKQVIVEVTGLDRADFTTHQARRILSRLGFPVGRRQPSRAASARQGGRSRASDVLSEALRSLTGRWVAVSGGEVLVAADTPHEAVEWLIRHGKRADSVFRVPEDEAAASGIAPA